MKDELECKVKVYRENDLQTVKHIMFSAYVEFDKEGKKSYRIAPTNDGGVYMEIDIYDPITRHIEYIEDRNEGLEARVQELEDTIEALECEGFGEDSQSREVN